MNVVVDEDLCTGCGLCEETCPTVFSLENDIAKVIVDAVPSEDEVSCREAAEECPVEAIVMNA